MSRRFAILERLVFVEIIRTTGFEPMAKESILIGLSQLAHSSTCLGSLWSFASQEFLKQPIFHPGQVLPSNEESSSDGA